MARGEGGLGNFFKGVRSEFKKVIWPNKKEAGKYTGTVIIISLLTALLVYILDLGFAALINLVL